MGAGFPCSLSQQAGDRRGIAGFPCSLSHARPSWPHLAARLPARYIRSRAAAARAQLPQHL